MIHFREHRGRGAAVDTGTIQILERGKATAKGNREREKQIGEEEGIEQKGGSETSA